MSIMPGKPPVLINTDGQSGINSLMRETIGEFELEKDKDLS